LCAPPAIREYVIVRSQQQLPALHTEPPLIVALNSKEWSSLGVRSFGGAGNGTTV
jgi:hypothetical protein